MGMIPLAMRKNDMVKSITIVEMSQEVIDMVWPRIEPMLPNARVVQGNIFRPNDFIVRGLKFDTIYFDIWDSVCIENWEHIQLLHKRYRSRIVKGGLMDSWARDIVKSIARRG